MIEHTHSKPRYGVVIGRWLFKYERPGKTARNEKYREPLPAGRKRYKNKAEAELARMHWEGKLI